MKNSWGCGIINNVIIIYILSIVICILTLLEILKNKNNKLFNYIFILIYFLYLYICLFLREEQINENFSNGKYIKVWIKLIFTNKIVFKNIVGNILIFIPFGVLLHKIKLKVIYKLLISILIIIIIEVIQLITKTGIFDILDIFLNIIGIVIGIVIKSKGENYE